MSRSTALLICCAALLLLGGLLVQRYLVGDGPQPSLEHMEQSGLPTALRPELEPERPAALRESALVVESEAVSPDTGKVIVEVTRNDDGTPAVGFLVSILADDKSLLGQGATDAIGQVTFEFAAGTELRNTEVATTPTTSPVVKWIDRTIQPGERLRIAVQVEEGWELAGRVMNVDGDPVPWAEVFGWCSNRYSGEPDRVVTADGAGEFRLLHLGPRFRVTAKAPGLACLLGLKGKLSANAAGLTIVLVPEKRVLGVVVDPHGTPVPGVEVWVDELSGTHGERNRTPVDGILTFDAGRGKTFSDQQGRFEIPGLSQHDYRIYARQPLYLVSNALCSTDGVEHVIVLDAGLSLRGRVIDAEGLPASGAHVRFWPFQDHEQTVRRGFRCDEKGEFLLTCLPRENKELPYSVSVLHDGHAVEVIQPVHPSDNGGEFLTVTLKRERVLAGRVIDLEGKPVSGVEVWIEGDREVETGVTWHRRSTWEFRNQLDSSRTDAQGQFRFPSLYDGEFVLHALFPGDPNRTVHLTARSGEERLELVLAVDRESHVTIGGKVRDGVSGDPIEAFTVVTSIEGKGTNWEFTSSDGSYELIGLPPGRIGVYLKAEGYATRQIPAREYGIGIHHLDATLVLPRRLEVEVVGDPKSAYRPLHVRVTDLAKQVLYTDRMGMRSDSVNLMGGKATLYGLPSEPLTLHVVSGLRPGYQNAENPLPQARSHELPVDLTSPRSQPLVVKLPQ